MGKADYAKLGDYNVICDRCHQKIKASRAKLQWDNLFVCHKCWEPRHPQDFIPSVVDDTSVPIARPEPEVVWGD